MPIYEYDCAGCDRTTEALRRMSAADDPIDCEHCGSAQTTRAHSVFAAGASQSGGVPLPDWPCGTCGNPGGSCQMG
jgi:putative FmdB family regulatory protein